MNLGEIPRTEGHFVTAARHYRASLSRLQLAGDPHFIAVAQINLGQVYLHEGDLVQAETVLRQSLAAGLRAENVQVVALALEKLADLLAVRDSERAGHLFGLAQGLRQASGVSRATGRSGRPRAAGRAHAAALAVTWLRRSRRPGCPAAVAGNLCSAGSPELRVCQCARRRRHGLCGDSAMNKIRIPLADDHLVRYALELGILQNGEPTDDK